MVNTILFQQISSKNLISVSQCVFSGRRLSTAVYLFIQMLFIEVDLDFLKYNTNFVIQFGYFQTVDLKYSLVSVKITILFINQPTRIWRRLFRVSPTQHSSLFIYSNSWPFYCAPKAKFNSFLVYCWAVGHKEISLQIFANQTQIILYSAFSGWLWTVWFQINRKKW